MLETESGEIMKTKRIRILLLAAALLAGACGQHALAADYLWMKDAQAAGAASKINGKYVLLAFSGTQWCGWCIKLEQEVFSRPAYKEYAAGNLICVLLDYERNGRPVERRLASQHTGLLSAYAVRAFPTVLVLNPAGKVIGRTGYRRGGPEAYVEHLKEVIGKDRPR